MTHDHRRGRDGGFATAEFAVALPAVILVLATVLGAVQALVLHHQALHAASVGARVAARGEGEAAIRAAAGRAGPPGARLSMRRSEGLVHVTVRPRVPAVLDWALPDLSAEVAAAEEPQDDAAEGAS